MNVLVILNDPAYRTERSYNGLRLAMSVCKRGDANVRVFLMGDAVACAMAGQRVPEGYYNLKRIIGSIALRGADIGCCGACLDARGITDPLLAKGAHHSSMDELTDWTLWADRVVSF